MHLAMLLLALAVATWLRCALPASQPNLLVRFALPPLVLTTVALNIVWMVGTVPADGGDWVAVLAAWAWLAWVVATGLQLSLDTWRSLADLRHYPRVVVQGQTARLLPADTLFAAEVGFWRSELVVSRGLLANLSPAHLDAVLAHELAHRHYRDTFYCFWLGWLKRVCPWPTASLWSELAALRELRADRRATATVDALVLAEALLLLASGEPTALLPSATLVGVVGPTERLEERITHLLTPEVLPPEAVFPAWWLLLLLLPFATLPMHFAASHCPCPSFLGKLLF